MAWAPGYPLTGNRKVLTNCIAKSKRAADDILGRIKQFIVMIKNNTLIIILTGYRLFTIPLLFWKFGHQALKPEVLLLAHGAG